LLVDAPLRPDDGRSWLAALRKEGASSRRLLVNLDSHPDRTLGAQSLDAEVIAHRETSRQFRRRAAIFKALKQESGAEWEALTGMSGLRWATPRIVYSQGSNLHLNGDGELRLEMRPGPTPGASWLVAPAAQVVFVGDLVTLKQPPFLALAEIESWVEGLDQLLSKEYKNYRIVAGRGGEATPEDLREMRKFLKEVDMRLEKLANRKSPGKEIDKLVPKLLERFKIAAKMEKMYSHRLKYGLQNYFARRYQGATRNSTL
jgi:glyoxylase-like metal-dependent hydrolase (beta-lactamase superfamily II)